MRDSAPAEQPALEWSGETDFRIGAIRYSCRPGKDTFSSETGRFCLRKPREAVEQYEELVRRLRPERIFEVGLFECGSTALIAQLARPEKLIGVDIGQEPVEAIAELARSEDLEDALSIHWGVDQSDGRRLRELAAAEAGDAPLDLVIDDASHQLRESRATFDALFPLLRPGGEYVLEDWAWAHAPISVWPHRAPLTALVAEAAIASAHAPGLVARVEIDRAWAIIHRGLEPADPDTFSIRAAIGERGREMATAMAERGREPTAGERG